MWERKDFKWIVASGFVLSVHSGFINACGMKSAFGLTITHVTGLVTRTAFSIPDDNGTQIVQAGSFVIAFMLGSFFTGMICGSQKFKLQPRYGLVLMIEGFLLFIGYMLLNVLEYPSEHSRYALLLMTCAVGMQNSMFTSFSGAVVRTCHLTGMINDLGMLCGQQLRYKLFVRNKQKSAEVWKLLVFGPLTIGFILGALIGSAVWNHLSIKAFLIPATSISLIGITFTIGLFYYAAKKIEREAHNAAQAANLNNEASNENSETVRNKIKKSGLYHTLVELSTVSEGLLEEQEPNNENNNNSIQLTEQNNVTLVN